MDGLPDQDLIQMGSTFSDGLNDQPDGTRLCVLIYDCQGHTFAVFVQTQDNKLPGFSFSCDVWRINLIRFDAISQRFFLNNCVKFYGELLLDSFRRM